MKKLLAIFCAMILTACSTHTPMKTVDYVDLDRFMGDWYVIANIPTFIETEAHNAVESYSLNEDGTINTVFTFHDGSFEGEKKRYNPKGFITDEDSNAVWGMQFIWPIKADFRVVYLDDDYGITIIGRNARDYVWLMAREPSIPEEKYQQLVQYIADLGYDASQINRVPQKWN